MLHFFRKYQKIFFFVITVVVIFSFTFFGTYSAFVPNKKGNMSFFEQFCHFLKCEGAGKDFASTNFLNDYVLTRDFIESGYALALFENEPAAFKEDLAERLQRESSFLPYVHPAAKSLSAEAVWAIFAPEIVSKLHALQKVEDPLDPEGFKMRLELFMAERYFPPQLLGQMLRMKLREQPLTADPKLAKGELSLFGYNGLEDWFGARFVQRAAQVIIEMAEQAKKEGYKVTKQELISDLLYHSEKARAAMGENLPVADSRALLQLFMRNWGLDEPTLLKMWETITLFRRLSSDVANGALVDSLPWQEFYRYAGESLQVEVKQMPEPFCFREQSALKELEIYLAALGGKRKDLLALPEAIKPSAKLVGSYYDLEIAELQKKNLVAKVSVQQTWAWEREHLELLQERFPELKGSSLEALEPKKRQFIDSFAREQIVESHPEWITDSAAPFKEKRLFFAKQSSKSPLEGIKDPLELKRLLDEKEQISCYSQDAEHFYTIRVKGRSEERLLTFEEAKKEGILNQLKVGFDEQLFTELLGQIAVKEKVALPEAYLYRFADYLRENKELTEEYMKQFTPKTKELTLTRIEPSFISYEQADRLQEGFGAAVGEGAFSYRVVSKKVDGTVPTAKMKRSSELLCHELRVQFMNSFLKTHPPA